MSKAGASQSRKYALLVAILAALSSVGSVTDSSAYFVYTRTEEARAQICWFALDAADDETCIDVPPFYYYAISPDSRFIAIQQTRQDDTGGSVGILDLEQPQFSMFDLVQPQQEFLWDEVYAVSGTLMWSPNSQYLAFTGMPTDDGPTDVYVYAVRSQTLTNITASIPIVRSLITPAAWSPDSEWLTLYGAWSEAADEAGRIIPDFGAAVISRAGTSFFEIAPDYNTCRLVWSPDMTWLVSDMACFTPAGTSSGLLLIPFRQTAAGQRIDAILSPIEINWRAGTSWQYQYGLPLWINEYTVVAHRQITPMTFGQLDPHETLAYASTGLVAIDMSTYSEVLVESGSYHNRSGNWFIAESAESTVTITNPIIGKTMTIPASIKSCPPSYALKIEAQGDYIAVLDACRIPLQNPAVRIYDTHQFHMVIEHEIGENGELRPLGFGIK